MGRMGLTKQLGQATRLHSSSIQLKVGKVQSTQKQHLPDVCASLIVFMSCSCPLTLSMQVKVNDRQSQGLEDSPLHSAGPAVGDGLKRVARGRA